MNPQFFFISTIDKNGDYVSYISERFRISELEILQLIRLMVIERRNISLGNKILEVYRDSTEFRKEEALSNLTKLGIKDHEKKHQIPKNSIRK